VIGSCGLLRRLWTSTPATDARDQESREERHADDEAFGEVGGLEYYGADGDRRGREDRDDVERKGAEQERDGADDGDLHQLAGQRQVGDLRAGGTDHEDHNVDCGDVDQDPARGECRVDPAAE
jgi:hypothetical protein